MKETLKLNFCEITMYENYAIVVVNEGVIVTAKLNAELVKIAEVYYSNRPFVYITHRINSYSVDPQVYFKTAQIKTLVGLVVVSRNYQAKINAEIEKMFFTKPFEIFTEMEDALTWAKKMTAE